MRLPNTRLRPDFSPPIRVRTLGRTEDTRDLIDLPDDELDELLAAFKVAGAQKPQLRRLRAALQSLSAGAVPAPPLAQGMSAPASPKAQGGPGPARAVDSGKTGEAGQQGVESTLDQCNQQLVVAQAQLATITAQLGSQEAAAAAQAAAVQALEIKMADSAQKVMEEYLDDGDDLDAELAAIRASPMPKGKTRKRFYSAWRAVEDAEAARTALLEDVAALRAAARTSGKTIEALEARIEQIQRKAPPKHAFSADQEGVARPWKPAAGWKIDASSIRTTLGRELGRGAVRCVTVLKMALIPSALQHSVLGV